MAEATTERGESDEDEISLLDKQSERRYAVARRILPKSDWRHRLARLVDASTEATLSGTVNEGAAVALSLTLSSFADWALRDALTVEKGEAKEVEREVKTLLARLQVAALSRLLRGGLSATTGGWWWNRLRAWFGGRARRKAPAAGLVIGPLCKNCLRPRSSANHQ